MPQCKIRDLFFIFLSSIALLPRAIVSVGTRQEDQIKEATFELTLPLGANSAISSARSIYVAVASHDNVVVCPFNTWAIWRLNEGRYNISEDAGIGHLCTHIIYRTMFINEKTYEIYFDDLGLHKRSGYFSSVVSMKSKYPHLKIIPSLGSWTLGVEVWSALVNSSANRAQFIKHSMEFLRDNNCSGLNLDWEYPRLDQKPLFTLLAKEMQDKFQKEGFLLTTTIWARMTQLERSYEISEITRIFDLVLVKFFDLYPDHAVRTGHNAPLHSETVNNVYNLLTYLIKNNANPEKMVLGVPFYGRPYLLNDVSSLDKNAGLNASSRSGEYQGPWSRDGAFLWGYNEICYNYSKEQQLPWKMYWDDYAKVPMNVNSQGRWMTFDNIRSIYEKVSLAKQFGLKGIMGWTLDMDDFRGYCGNATHPLLKTINYALSTVSSTDSALCSFIDSQNYQTKKSFYKPIVTTNVYNLSVHLNSEVKVECTVQGFPRPKIQWVKGAKTLTNPVKRITSQSIKCPPYHVIHVSTMDIAKFKRADAGMYLCEAENEHGKANRVFYLREFLDPNGISHEVNQGTPWGWIAFGIVAFLLLIASILGFFVHRRMVIIIKNGMTREEIREFLEGSKQTAKANDYQDIAPENLPYDNSYELSLKQYEIDKETILGSGAFGIVYKGRVGEVEVAVKSTKPGADKQYLKSLLSELKILAYLGQHSNVVNLVGASTPHLKQGVVYMFVELCPLGNLLDYLRNNCRQSFKQSLKNSDLTTNQDEEKNSLLSVTTNDLYSWALQIAKALQHLHSKNVIHGDLAARNILVFERNVVKITDFGLSRKLYEYSNYVKKNEEPLPWRWMAIESLRDLAFSFKSDVWAFGITVWEIFSLGETPYPGLNWTTDFVEGLSNDLRCPKPKYSSDTMYDIMMACWRENPDSRLGIDKIIKDISESLKNRVAADYIELERKKSLKSKS